MYVHKSVALLWLLSYCLQELERHTVQPWIPPLNLLSYSELKQKKKKMYVFWTVTEELKGH